MILVCALALVILTPIAYLVGLALYAHTRRVRHDLAMLDLNRAQRRVYLTRVIYADTQGVYPLLWDGQLCLDPSRGVVFTLEGVQSLTPDLAQPEQIARALRAGGGWPRVPLPEAPQSVVEQAQVLPSRVPLIGLLDRPPSLQGLVLGVALDQGGNLQIVKESMVRLVHIAVGGSSGWGKSVFLRALAYQLAQAVEKPALALVDLEGVTFAPFAQSERLLWPVADTEADALAVFRALADELDRRKGLYAAYPGVDSLAAYNRTCDEPLPAIVCLVDEATALLGDKSVESAARTLASGLTSTLTIA